MDKTEIFVKMCENAEEIQRMSPRVFITSNAVNIPFYDLEGNCWFNRNNEKSIWLPRQDQLQELTGIESIPTLLSQFNEFVFENVEYATQFIDSCEKLWLAFVMKKRYNKTWNEEEWIKEEEE